MPTEQQIDTSATPTVTIERITGRLAVRTWDEPRVQLRSTGDGPRFAYDGDSVTVMVNGNAQLWIPSAAMLRVQRVDSDVHLVGIGGAVEAERIAGNVLIEDTGAITITRTHGNVLVKQCRGSVILETVNGNVALQGIDGAVTVGRCQGNFSARAVLGAIAAQVNGNAMLRLLPQPDGNVTVEARGNIHCRLPIDAQAHVQAEAGGRIRAIGPDGSMPPNSADFTLGEGGAQITLQARGNVDVRCIDPDEEMGIDITVDPELTQELVERTTVVIDQMSAQIESQMDAFAQRLNEQFSRYADSDEIVGKVQEKVQRALRRAEEKLNEASRRAAEREARRNDRRMRPAPPPPPPVPPRPTRRPPVTAEERMRVLRLLEDGKITVEQAEKLLAALTGKTD